MAAAEPGPFDPRVALALGYESSVNDPVAIRHGPHFGATVNFHGWIELGAAGGWFPVPPDGGCNAPDILQPALVCPYSETSHYSYNFSRLVGELEVELRILPLHARFGAWEAAGGLATSVGVVATEDDLFVMYAEDEPEDGDAHRTASELHPSFGGGLFGEVRHAHVGFRLRLRTLEFIEVHRSSSVSRVQYLLAGAEVLWWF